MDLSIGELSRRTSVKVTTIRYYEGIGLLSSPPRTAGGQRRYGEADVERLNFVREARGLGFEIEDIRALLELSEGRPGDAEGRAKAARVHIAAVARRMAKLRRLGASLDRVAAPDGGPAAGGVVAALLGE